MIQVSERQRAMTGWLVSALFHAALLFLGAALLIRPAQFHVNPGRTSTEIDFSNELPPSPPPVVVPTPVPPAPPPPLPIQPVVKPDDFVVPPPKPIPPPMPAPVSPAPAMPHLAKQAVRATTVHHQEASSPSKGAIQAQPDDLQNQPPEYPEESRAASEQGVVLLRVQVTAEGLPASVTILRSSGYFHLDQAARRAVEHWRFHPGLIAGIPAPSEVDVPVRFKLQ